MANYNWMIIKHSPFHGAKYGLSYFRVKNQMAESQRNAEALKYNVLRGQIIYANTAGGGSVEGPKEMAVSLK